MARTYIDLLTFPMRAGGKDTPRRLAWIASELSYSVIGIFSSDSGNVTPQRIRLAGTQTIVIAEEGTRTARKADIRFASGKGARHAASTGAADFILPDPKDSVTLKFAADNDVPIAYPYSRLIEDYSMRRSSLIRMWSKMHSNARKYGCRELLVSAAHDSYLIRDPRDLASMMCSCLNMHTEEALDWVSTTPQEVLEHAEEGRSG